jgi:hypothetical protein
MGPAEIPTYLEIGAKRTFAGALDWPGWCRAGRDEAAALEALHGAGRRYAKVLQGARLGFESPKDPSRFTIVECLQGDATTDFGAPSITPIEDAELRRSRSILRACWRSFDAAVDGARGKTLAKGPRGGGRDLRIDRRPHRGRGGQLPPDGGPEGRGGTRGGPRRTHPCGGPGGTRDHRETRPSAARAAGRHAMATSILRPPRDVARPRSRVGDRGSREVSVRRERVHRIRAPRVP